MKRMSEPDDWYGGKPMFVQWQLKLEVLVYLAFLALMPMEHIAKSVRHPNSWLLFPWLISLLKHKGILLDEYHHYAQV